MVDKKQVFFIHARPLSKKQGFALASLHYSATRGVTFAIKYVNKLVGFKMAMANCGKKDNFNRKLGRQIAEARLNSTGWWKAKALSDVVEQMVETCGRNGYVLPVRSLTYLEETFNGKVRRKD